MPLRLRRAAFLVFLACIALATAEVAARVDDRIRLGIPFARTPDYDHDLRYKDWFGIRGRSNGRYRHWQLDNYGFRGPDVTLNPAPGCTRIMILGASETFGLYESDGKEYAAQVRDSMRTRGCYEVINAAIAGAVLPGIIRLWQNYGAQFKPSIVLMYPSASFYLGVNPPGWPSMPGKPEQPSDLPFRPRLIDQFKNVWETPAFLQRFRLNRWIAQATAGKPADWFFRDPPQDRIDQFMGDLDSLVKSIRATGAKPILMTHAMRFTIPPRPEDEFVLLDWRSGAPRATDNALLGTEHNAAEQVRAYARKENLCLIDVDRNLTGRPGYFADFAHFTDAGSTAVAALIMRQLTGGPSDSAHAGEAEPTDQCSLNARVGGD